MLLKQVYEISVYLLKGDQVEYTGKAKILTEHDKIQIHQKFGLET